MPTAVTEGYPFAGGAGAIVTEAQWRTMVREWLASGVLAEYLNELEVVQDTPASMSVTVRAGQARLEGHVGIQTADVDLAIAANASGQPRIDVVVIRADYDANVIELDVLQGTPGAVPVAEPVTQDATMYELALAEVVVADGAVSIVTANITDRRVFTYAEQDPPLPAMTTTERDALTHVRNGLLIYNSTLGKVQGRIGGAWVNMQTVGGTTIRVAWTYTLPGEIKVASGSTDFLPLVPIAVPAGQAVSLVGYRWTLPYPVGAASFTFGIYYRPNGGPQAALVTGVVAAQASYTGAGSFTPQAAADLSTWAPVISAVSGSPAGGSVAIVADITV